jgi:hypothetical protein
LSFRFPALAALAGRAPIGGQREVALAVYVAARLADDAVPDRALPTSIRAERATGARNWLASATLPQTVRAPLMKLIVRSAGDDSGATGGAVRAVLAAATTHLSPAVRSELTTLATSLEAQAIVG